MAASGDRARFRPRSRRAPPGRRSRARVPRRLPNKEDGGSCGRGQPALTRKSARDRLGDAPTCERGAGYSGSRFDGSAAAQLVALWWKGDNAWVDAVPQREDPTAITQALDETSGGLKPASSETVRPELPLAPISSEEQRSGSLSAA